MIPILGSVISEVVATRIPDLWKQRFEEFLVSLAARTQTMSPEFLDAKFADPEHLDLFQESVNQAIRALRSERIEYLSALLAASLTDEDMQHLQYKWLLSILSEVSDAELIILKYYNFREVGYMRTPDPTSEFDQFEARHRALIQIEKIGWGTPNREPIVKRNAMRQSFIAHLVRLGLLENMYDTPKPGDDFEKVKFDESKGTLKPAQGIAAGAYYVSLIVGVRSATMRIVIQ